MSVIALIPAHNEQARIVQTVTAVGTITEIDRVIVIDDGSTDRTAELAAGAGAEVVSLAVNSGKGAALNAGLARATSRGEDPVILLLDADLGDSAAQAGSLLLPVVQGVADMTIAAFPRPQGKAGFGLVKGLARRGIRRLGNPDFPAHAPLSGQRALSPAARHACTPFAQGYGVEIALTVHALQAGLRVLEVETTMTHAATGRDLAGFLHRGRQFLHVLRTLVALSKESGSRRTRSAED